MKDFEEVAKEQNESLQEKADPATPAPAADASKKPKKQFYQRWWFWLIVAVVVLNVVDKFTEITDSEESSKPVQAVVATAPQPTSVPTSTPVSLQPKVYSGYGDDVLEIDSVLGYVFHITGNSSCSHFSVTTYDKCGNYVALLVNTTDIYDGIVFDASFLSYTFEIDSNSDWTIELTPLIDCPVINKGETYNGTGDSVVIISGAENTADIVGNEASSHFSVISYDNYGNYLSLLVNTTDIYSGRVLLRGNPAILEINAKGNWSVTLN